MSQEPSSQVQNYTYQSVQDNLIARGSSSTTAFQLALNVNCGATYNRFTSTPAGAGCMLPPAVAGMMITICNVGGNTLQVYPAPGDVINGIPNVGVQGVPMMNNSVVTFQCSSTGLWQTTDLGTGFVTNTQGAAVATFSTQTGVIAHAGGGQGSATPIAAAQVQISTVTTLNDSVLLPPSQPGMEIVIVNNGANAANIFPFSGDQINALGVNTAFSAAVASVTIFFCFVAGTWVTK